MKKKLGEFTLLELEKKCEKGCDNCLFNDDWHCPISHILDEYNLDEEIEVEENE